MTARRRKAGRSLGVALSAFVLGQCALNLAMETVRPEWRDPEYGWRLKAVRALDSARGVRPLILAFGSSRTQMGLSPHGLGSVSPAVFNFGQAGAGPIQTFLNLRRVLDSGVRPAAVLVEIMPATLAYRGTTETFYHDTTVRLDLGDLRRLQPYCDSPGSLRARWLAERALPWYAMRRLLLSHWHPTLLHWKERLDFQWRLMDDRGWAKFPFEAIDDDFRRQQTDHVRAQYVEALARFEISTIADQILRDTVALCRREGIALAFYRMPEGSAFREWLPATGRYKLRSYLDELSRELSVPIFDASEWLPDSEFSDGHHLLQSGARAFSERFGRDVLEKWPEPRN